MPIVNMIYVILLAQLVFEVCGSGCGLHNKPWPGRALPSTDRRRSRLVGGMVGPKGGGAKILILAKIRRIHRLPITNATVTPCDTRCVATMCQPTSDGTFGQQSGGNAFYRRGQ